MLQGKTEIRLPHHDLVAFSDDLDENEYSFLSNKFPCEIEVDLLHKSRIHSCKRVNAHRFWTDFWHALVHYRSGLFLPMRNWAPC